MTDNSNRRQTKHLAVSRRGALQAGLLGLGGLSLPAFLRQQANAGETLAGDTAVIFLFLHGGPSQLETYDMKPSATREVRGPFHPISTAVPDLQACELLPLHAKIADRFTLIRSCTHGDGGHFEAHGRFMSGNAGLKPGTGHLQKRSRRVPPRDWKRILEQLLAAAHCNQDGLTQRHTDDRRRTPQRPRGPAAAIRSRPPRRR